MSTGAGCRSIAIASFAAVVALSGCGSHIATKPSVTPQPHVSSVHSSCARTIQGVVQTSALAYPFYLPHGFRLTQGDPTDVTSGGLTFEGAGPFGGRPRITVSVSTETAPLSPSLFGRPGVKHVVIQGHPGLLATGLPAPFQSVDWKPTSTVLVNAGGWAVSRATLLRFAANLRVVPGGVVNLPVVPRTLIARSGAVALVRRLYHPAGETQSRLTSWTELAALIQSSSSSPVRMKVPAWLRLFPWRPIWAVVHLSLRRSSVQSRPSIIRRKSRIVATPAPKIEIGTLAVVDARTGNEHFFGVVHGTASWVRELTDRDPSLSGCPGGSSSRVPFGVLTRQEEEYTQRGGAAGQDGRVIHVIKLTTLRALDRHGLGGGGPGNPVAGSELVWPDISVERAAPGKTLACLPPSASYPPGYRPKQVKEYSVIADDGNSEIKCGPLPKWVWQLKDLAPPG